MRINGLPVWGILAGGLALWFWGFLVYGVLFTDAWMAAEKLTEADYEGNSPLWMLGGILISFATAKGLAFVLKWRDWPNIPGAIATAAIMALTFALSVNAYDLIYLPDHSWTVFFIDCFHLIVGWIIAAVVITLLK
jgi:hypothetical protein